MSSQIKIGSGVIIRRDNSILLGKRAIDTPEEGYQKQINHSEETWSIPGGKLEIGETVAECATREVKEECGLAVRNLRLVSVIDPGKITGSYLVLGFVTEDFEGEVKTLEPEKMKDWQWFDLNDLPSPLFPPAAETIERYKSGVVYK